MTSRWLAWIAFALSLSSGSVWCQTAPQSNWWSAPAREDGPPRTVWDHLALASLALDAALDGAPAARAEELVDRALSGLGLLADARQADYIRSMSGIVLLLIDRFDRAGAIFDEVIERTSALDGTRVGRAALQLCDVVQQVLAPF